MPKTTPTSHPARTQLQQLVARQPTTVRDAVPRVIWEIDTKTAKEAAVLILFGVLDDAPAATPCQQVSADLDVLILVRSGKLRHHAGQPAFPGGRIDPEDYEQAAATGQTVERIAALREAVEETGLDPTGVEVLGQLPQMPLPVSNFLVTPVIGWWALPTPVDPVDVNESTLVMRVPVADLLAAENRHTATVTRGKEVHKSPAFDVQGEGGTFTIWGLTGIILSTLFSELGWEEPWDKTKRREATT